MPTRGNEGQTWPAASRTCILLIPCVLQRAIANVVISNHATDLLSVKHAMSAQNAILHAYCNNYK